MQGIYQIRNIKTNQIYIGSSKNIERRWKEHQYRLECNAHHSIKLQRSYNKSKDKSIFVYELIEEIKDINLLKDREQYYINLYDAYNTGYNCCAVVDNPKYTLKNQRKLTKLQLRNLYYDEFMTLYGQYNDCIELGYTFTERLSYKEYAYSTYKAVNTILKWFIESYGENYKLRYSFTGNRQYYFAIHDKDDNVFAYYQYKKGKVVASEDDVKMCIQHLKDKYDPIIHYIVQ